MRSAGPGTRRLVPLKVSKVSRHSTGFLSLSAVTIGTA